MTDLAKEFDKSLRQTIDQRAAYKSRVDALRSNIRAAAELAASSHRIDPKKAKSAKGQLQPYVDASVAMILDECRYQVAKIVEKEVGVAPPEHMIPDEALTPFIDIYEAGCISGIKQAFAG